MRSCKFQVGDRVLWSPWNSVSYKGTIVSIYNTYIPHIVIQIDGQESHAALEENLTLIPTGIDKLDEIL